MKTQNLPDEVLDKARARRGHTDAQAWDDADFVADVVAEFTRSRGDRTRALKQLAQHMGISRGATSDLCQLAETYEPGARQRYADTLTIGHYREAMRCKTVAPIKLLELAIESADEWGGYPMPVDVLRQTVRAHNAGIEPAKGPKELYKLCIDRAHKLLGDALQYAPKGDQKSLTSMREWLAKVE